MTHRCFHGFPFTTCGSSRQRSSTTAVEPQMVVRTLVLLRPASYDGSPQQTQCVTQRLGPIPPTDTGPARLLRPNNPRLTPPDVQRWTVCNEPDHLLNQQARAARRRAAAQPLTAPRGSRVPAHGPGGQQTSHLKLPSNRPHSHCRFVPSAPSAISHFPTRPSVDTRLLRPWHSHTLSRTARLCR